MQATLRSRAPAPGPSSGPSVSRWTAAAAGLRVLIGMLAIMWVVWVANALDSYRLDGDGILPRNVAHLWGILTAPFIHGSFGHIFGNSIPFLILGVVIAAAGARRLIVVTIISILISGAGVWLTASAHSETFGASGVVFGFAAYLVTRGIFSRRIIELLLGLVVGATFGLSLLSDLVPRAGVSWQAHLFGAIAGVLAAALLDRRGPHRLRGPSDRVPAVSASR